MKRQRNAALQYSIIQLHRVLARLEAENVALLETIAGRRAPPPAPDPRPEPPPPSDPDDCPECHGAGRVPECPSCLA